MDGLILQKIDFYIAQCQDVIKRQDADKACHVVRLAIHEFRDIIPRWSAGPSSDLNEHCLDDIARILNKLRAFRLHLTNRI